MHFSSSLSTFILGCLLLQPAVSQCPVEEGLKCKTCDENTETWQARCDLQVSMKCTFVDPADGLTKSCFADTQVGNDAPEPRWTISQELCDLRPTAYEYEATIVYEMCNINPEGFRTRPDLADANYNSIRFRDGRNLDVTTNLNVDGWDDPMTGGECKTHTMTETFKPCEKPFRGMSISMDGTLSKAAPNYCRCFLREWVRSEITPRTPRTTTAPTISVSPSGSPSGSPSAIPTEDTLPPTSSPTKAPSTFPPTTSPTKASTTFPTKAPTTSPTKAPTTSPTKAPTTSPTKAPTKVPSKAPTAHPTLTPTPKCKADDVILTELASPEETFAKYIEVLFLDNNCKGETINIPLKIIRYADGDQNPSSNVVDLQGVRVREDGFVTICNSETAEHFYGRDECTVVAGLSSPANLRGTETIALVVGEPIDEAVTIDIFGVPGQSASDSESYFKNGRAVRKINVWTPSDSYDTESWHVWPQCGLEVGPEGMDINLWVDVPGPVCDNPTIIITEIVDLDVDSSGNNVPRYVELHAPRRRDRGHGFDYDLKLVIFHGDSVEPHWDSAVSVDYMPENGFMVVCNGAAREKFGDECALTSYHLGGPADSNGNDQIALISGDESSWYVVDIFGVVGEAGFDTDHEFMNSRVVRKLDVDEARATWSKEDWTICKSDYPDPNEWNFDTCGTKAVPSDSPTDSPTPDSQKNCEFFFTELADRDSSYVEIKSTCPGIKISRPITVVSYKDYGASCEVNLKGVTVPDDGFIIICRNRIQHEIAYGGNPIFLDGSWHDVSTCDIEDYMLLAGHGYNSYAIMDSDSSCDRSNCFGSSCSLGCNDKILDIYGYIGAFLIGTLHEYKDCRAVRKLRYPFGLSTFDPNVWDIVCEAPTVVVTCDPRVWKEVPLVIAFSEFCDPSDGKEKRFIELYSPNKRNYKIEDDLIIMKWVGANPNPEYVYQSLKGQTIDENGFLVVCINFYYWGSHACEVATGYNSFTSNFQGDQHFGLAECAYPSNNCECMDTYGVTGTVVTTSSPQYFMDGRAARMPNVLPRKMFDIGQWVVETPVTAAQCDPGTFPPPTPPSPTPPAPTPPSGPSKGGKGKSKLRR